MCGKGDLNETGLRIRMTLGELGDIDVDFDLSKRHDFYPGSRIPIAHRGGSRLRLDAVTWGTIDPVTKKSIYNARSESIAKGTLRTWTRGLAIFSTFFEWTDEKPRHRKPFAARARDGGVLVLAALYERPQAPDGRILGTSRIVTQPSRGRLAEIHHRMPLLLAPAAFHAWLDPALGNREALDAVRSDQVDLASLEVVPAVLGPSPRQGLLFDAGIR